MHIKIIRFLYKNILKRILFLFDPEFVHDRTTTLGRILGSNRLTRSLTAKLFKFTDPVLIQNIHGIRFENPVGLTAGFDKDANLVDILDCIGFGYMQVGSVTLHPYEGNPGKRLLRLKKSKSILVNYGLKNIGVDKVIERLSKRKSTFPISISIAKTNSAITCQLDEGIADYIGSYKKCLEAGVGDFHTFNISCPNSHGGRDYNNPGDGENFADPDRLSKLLDAINEIAPPDEDRKPVFLKLQINRSWDDTRELLEVAKAHGVEGVIIGNLNKDRSDPDLLDTIPDGQKGGFSGYPNKKLANNLISKTFETYADDFVIVGVGGIFNADDAYEKIRLGASLLQLATGLIYEGPQVVHEINRGLARRIKADGFRHLSDAVGADVKRR